MLSKEQQLKRQQANIKIPIGLNGPSDHVIRPFENRTLTKKWNVWISGVRLLYLKCLKSIKFFKLSKVKDKSQKYVYENFGLTQKSSRFVLIIK